MEYEKNEKRNIADFHVLGLFMAKKHDLSDKKISVCTSFTGSALSKDSAVEMTKSVLINHLKLINRP
jgi:hypothetical protein